MQKLGDRSDDFKSKSRRAELDTENSDSVTCVEVEDQGR